MTSESTSQFHVCGLTTVVAISVIVKSSPTFVWSSSVRAPTFTSGSWMTYWSHRNNFTRSKHSSFICSHLYKFLSICILNFEDAYHCDLTMHWQYWCREQGFPSSYFEIMGRKIINRFKTSEVLNWWHHVGMWEVVWWPCWLLVEMTECPIKPRHVSRVTCPLIDIIKTQRAETLTRAAAWNNILGWPRYSDCVNSPYLYFHIGGYLWKLWPKPIIT